MPLPDPNPNRAGTMPFAMKGTLAPAIAVPPPAMDYASILKPILSYDLSAGDEANVREVIRSRAGGGGEDQGSRGAGFRPLVQI